MNYSEHCQYSTRLLDKLKLLDNRKILDFDLINKAIYWAKEYHGDQKRKSGEPYYSHPLEVAYLFAEYAAEEEIKYYTTDLIITAVLHDTIEDTSLTKEMISQNFNKSIASKIEDLTRIKFNRKITAGETVNSLFLQHKKDVLYIKLFDRLHNMITIGCMTVEKKKKIVEETIIHFIPLASYLNANEVKLELTRLCLKEEPNKQNLNLPILKKYITNKSVHFLFPTFQNVIEKIYNPK